MPPGCPLCCAPVCPLVAPCAVPPWSPLCAPCVMMMLMMMLSIIGSIITQACTNPAAEGAAQGAHMGHTRAQHRGHTGGAGAHRPGRGRLCWLPLLVLLLINWPVRRASSINRLGLQLRPFNTCSPLSMIRLGSWATLSPLYNPQYGAKKLRPEGIHRRIVALDPICYLLEWVHG